MKKIKKILVTACIGTILLTSTAFASSPSNDFQGTQHRSDFWDDVWKEFIRIAQPGPLDYDSAGSGGFAELANID